MDKVQMPSLQEIAAWLESEQPPTEQEAMLLFEVTIPAALDAEVMQLQEQSKQLLTAAAQLAHVDPKVAKAAGAELVGEKVAPESCAECSDAKPVHSYGEWLLRCMYTSETEAEIVHRPVLGRVMAEDAFKQPADISKAQLLSDARAHTPPPSWCPRR